VSRLSIIIPVLNKLAKLEDTLVSVLENRPANCQIVVVLNEPYADPYQLRDEVCFVDAAKKTNLVESINLGLEKCTSPIVHILSCGMEVSPGWADSALKKFKAKEVAAVVPVIFNRLNQDTTISAGACYRASGKAERIGFGNHFSSLSENQGQFITPDTLAAFYRRSTVEALGGFNPSIGGHLAGVDFGLAMHFAGLQCVYDPECKMFANADDAIGAARMGGGIASERLFWTWADKIGFKKSLACHGALVFKECFECLIHPTTIFRLVCRAWAMIGRPWKNCFVRTPIKSIPTGGHPIAPPHFAAKHRRKTITCSLDK
jgi:hypothetical protein